MRTRQEISQHISIACNTYGRRQNKLCFPFRTDEYETYERIVLFSFFFRPSVPFRFILFLKKRTVLINTNTIILGTCVSFFDVRGNNEKIEGGQFRSNLDRRCHFTSST